MISRLRTWYSSRRRGTKILLGVGGGLVALMLLYVTARTLQYAGASRTSAALFVPDGADVVVRVNDLSGRWSDIQKTEFWRAFTRKLQKDPGVRRSLNEILAAAGAPTLDQLEDRRWLDRNPLMTEDSVLRYAGRDVALTSIGSKYCVATRLGWRDYLLLPGLQIFPGAAGAQRTEVGGATVLKRGDLFIAVQGAIVVASNDSALLASALQRRGKADAPPGLVRATFKPQAIVPTLKAFPLGALMTGADLETAQRVDLDIEIAGADLVVRAMCDRMAPRKPDPAPADTVQMIPDTGLGACLTNVDTTLLWDWWRGVADRRQRAATGMNKFARDFFGEYVEVLSSQRFGEEVASKLDGPVSVLFGASEGEDGKTYASVALYLRSSQPREAADALQGVIDRATGNSRDHFKPTDDEAGGISFRSYRFEPDPLRLNNFMAVCYAVTGDALIIANNSSFLRDTLLCRANQKTPMAVQLHYEQSMRRLQALGMKKVMGTGAVTSLYLYGLALRQGLEGFYGTLASQIVETPRSKVLLRQELETAAAKEGQPIRPADLDVLVRKVLDERIRAKEDSLRGYARILDHIKWVAYQADVVPEGMKLELAIELR